MVTLCTSEVKSWPAPVTTPPIMPASLAHDIITVKHHNYTLPIILVKENVDSSSTHAINQFSSAHVEYEEDVAVDDHKMLSEEYKEEALSESFTSAHEKHTNYVSVPPGSDAPLSESGLEEPNATFPVKNTKLSENPKPKPEVLQYFRQLIADINSASKSGPEMYKILPAADRDVQQASNKSDVQQSMTVPSQYMFESESAPPTLLYSFPLNYVLPEIAVKNASRKSKFSLYDEISNKTTSTPVKISSITFESPVSFINKSSVRPASQEQNLTVSIEHNTTQYASPPKLHFLESTNHSLPILEGEEILESAASHTEEVYYTELPQPPLTNEHLTSSLYQYDAAPPHLVPKVGLT